MDDLVGSEITKFEEVSGGGAEDGYGSQTWTFFKIGTIKGEVTIRFYEHSNGYYSESPDVFIEVKRGINNE